MNDKGKQFYDYLVSKDIKVPATYEEFQSSMQDSAIASQFHSFVKSKGITVPESVDEFSSVFSIQEAQESVPDVKKKEQTEPTQAVQTQQAAPTQVAPLPGLGGVSEEPTPSPSVGQGVLRDVDRNQPRGEAFISQASDLTRTDVREPQVDGEELPTGPTGPTGATGADGQGDIVPDIDYETMGIGETPTGAPISMDDPYIRKQDELRRQARDNNYQFGIDEPDEFLPNYTAVGIPENVKESDVKDYLSNQIGEVQRRVNQVMSNPEAYGFPQRILSATEEDIQELTNQIYKQASPASTYNRGRGGLVPLPIESQGENFINLDESYFRNVVKNAVNNYKSRYEVEKNERILTEITSDYIKAGYEKEKIRGVIFGELSNQEKFDQEEKKLYDINNQLRTLRGQLSSLTPDSPKYSEVQQKYNGLILSADDARKKLGDDREALYDTRTGERVDKIDSPNTSDLTLQIQDEMDQLTFEEDIQDVYIKAGLADNEHRSYGQKAKFDIEIPLTRTGKTDMLMHGQAIDGLKMLGYQSSPVLDEDGNQTNRISFKDVSLSDISNSYVRQAVRKTNEKLAEDAERWHDRNVDFMVKRIAARNMSLLNIDPGKIKKEQFSALGIDFYPTRMLEVIGEEVLPKGMTEEIGISDVKLVDNAIPQLEAHGIELTESQKENAKRGIDLEVQEGVASFVPVIGELAFLNKGAGALKTVTGLGKIVETLRTGSKLERGTAIAIEALIEEGQMQIADMNTGAGASFSIMGNRLRKYGLDKFPLRFKGELARLNKLGDNVWSNSMTGVVTMEFASNVEAAIEDFMGGETMQNHIEQNYSDLSEVGKRGLVNALVFNVIGARGLIGKGQGGFRIRKMEEARDEMRSKGYTQEADRLDSYIKEYYAGKKTSWEVQLTPEEKSAIRNRMARAGETGDVEIQEWFSKNPEEGKKVLKKGVVSVGTFDKIKSLFGIRPEIIRDLSESKVEKVGENYEVKLLTDGKEVASYKTESKEEAETVSNEINTGLKEKESVGETVPTVTEPTGDIVPAKQKGRLTKFSTPKDGIVGEVTYEDGTKKELTQEEYDALEKQEGLFDVETGTQPVAEAVPVEVESLETGGVKYYRTDENGNEIGSTEVTPVGNKIQIDNVFVKEGEKRKGVATSIIDKVISDYSGKTYDYIDENGNTFSEPYQIEVGTIVSEEGEAFIGSVRDKIDKFNVKQETVPAEAKEAAIAEPISEASLEDGRVEITNVKSGTHTSTKPIKIFKGIGGKKDLKGARINAHKGAEGFFTAVDKNLAEDYARGEGVSETVLPKGTTFEVVEIDGTGMTPGQYRDAEVKAINESKADVVKLITVDGKIKAGTKKQEQYVIKNEKLIEDAIQEQAAGKVPVQPEAKAGEKVEEGEPKAEPEKPTQEGKEVLSEEDAKSEEKVKEFVEENLSDEKKQEEADKEIESKSEEELKEDVPDVLESISETEREKLDREAKFKGKSTVDYVIDYLKGKLKNVRQSIKNILEKIKSNYRKAIITTAVIASVVKGSEVKIGGTSLRDVFKDATELVVTEGKSKGENLVLDFAVENPEGFKAILESYGENKYLDAIAAKAGVYEPGVFEVENKIPRDKPTEGETPIGLMALPLLFGGTRRRRKPLENADADKVVTDWMEDVQRIYDAQKTKDKQAAVDEAATNLAMSGRLNEIAPDQRLKVLEDIAKQTAAMDEKKSVSITSELQGLTLKEQFKQGFEEYVSAMKQKESDRKEKAKEVAQKKIDAEKEKVSKLKEKAKQEKEEAKQGFEEYLDARKRKEAERIQKIESKLRERIDNLKEKAKEAVQNAKDDVAARKIFNEIIKAEMNELGLGTLKQSEVTRLLSMAKNADKKKVEELIENGINLMVKAAKKNLKTAAEASKKKLAERIKKGDFGTADQKAIAIANIPVENIPVKRLPEYYDLLDNLVSKRGKISAVDLNKASDFIDSISEEIENKIGGVETLAELYDVFDSERKIESESQEYTEAKKLKKDERNARQQALINRIEGKAKEEFKSFLEELGMPTEITDFANNEFDAIVKEHKRQNTEKGKPLTSAKKIEKIKEKRQQAIDNFNSLYPIEKGSRGIDVSLYKNNEVLAEAAAFFNKLGNNQLKDLLPSEINALPLIYENMNFGLMTSSVFRIMSKIKGSMTVDQMSESSSQFSRMLAASPKDLPGDVKTMAEDFTLPLYNLVKPETPTSVSIKDAKELGRRMLAEQTPYIKYLMKGIKGDPVYEMLNGLTGAMTSASSMVTDAKRKTYDLFMGMKGLPLENNMMISTFHRIREHQALKGEKDITIRRPIEYVDAKIETARTDNQGVYDLMVGIKDKYFDKNGDPKIDKLTGESLIEKEINKRGGKELVDFMDKMNEVTREMGRTIAVIRGIPYKEIDLYGASRAEHGTDNLSEKMSKITAGKTLSSVKSGAVLSRTGNTKKTFDAVGDFLSSFDNTVHEYYLTEPLSTISNFVSIANKTGNVNLARYANAIKDYVSGSIENQIKTNYSDGGFWMNLMNDIISTRKSGAVFGLGVKPFAETFSQINKILLIPEARKSFMTGIQVLKESGDGVLNFQKAFEFMRAIQSTHQNRAGVLNAEVYYQPGYFERKLKSNTGKYLNIYNKLRPLLKPTKGMKRGLQRAAEISQMAPDAFGVIQVNIGAFAEKFKELTGKYPDINKIIEDKQYRAENADAIRKSRAYADKLTSSTAAPSSMSEVSKAGYLLPPFRMGYIKKEPGTKSQNLFILDTYSGSEKRTLLTNLKELRDSLMKPFIARGMSESWTGSEKKTFDVLQEITGRNVAGISYQIYRLLGFATLNTLIQILEKELFGTDEEELDLYEEFEKGAKKGILDQALLPLLGNASWVTRLMLLGGIYVAAKYTEGELDEDEESYSEEFKKSVYLPDLNRYGNIPVTVSKFGFEGQVAADALELSMMVESLTENQSISSADIGKLAFLLSRNAAPTPQEALRLMRLPRTMQKVEKANKLINGINSSFIVDEKTRAIYNTYIELDNDKSALPSDIRNTESINVDGVSVKYEIDKDDLMGLYFERGKLINGLMTPEILSKLRTTSDPKKRKDILKSIYKEVNNLKYYQLLKDAYFLKNGKRVN